MKNLLAIATLLIATRASCSDPSDALGLRKFVCPEYPHIARKAQVSGDVRILIMVMPDGSVQVEKASGPAILANYAKKNVQEWRFNAQAAKKEIEITYSYQLREPKIGGDVAPAVSLESPTHVIIISNLPMPSGHPE